MTSERSVTVPVPALNLEYLTARSDTAAYGDIEAVVFEKLTSLSDGNPGLACRLWERSSRDGEIAPAYVEEGETTLDRNDDQAFLLELMVAKEVLSVPALHDILVTNSKIDAATTIDRGKLDTDQITIQIDVSQTRSYPTSGEETVVVDPSGQPVTITLSDSDGVDGRTTASSTRPAQHVRALSLSRPE